MAKLVLGNDKTVGVPAVVKELIPVEPYPLLSRVKDDSNNEIGTVCGYQVDANNQKYAVVCLDAQYRGASGKYLSTGVTVDGLSTISNLSAWDNTDTATSNCTKILDFATANNYTSTAVSHCRSKSFVIGGTTYYGQLPNISELVKVFMSRSIINNLDTSASQYSSLILPTTSGGSIISSTQQQTSINAWGLVSNGAANSFVSKTSSCMVVPVLEIPIQ